MKSINDILHHLQRKELQKVAKEIGVKANKKSCDLITEILAIGCTPENISEWTGLELNSTMDDKREKDIEPIVHEHEPVGSEVGVRTSSTEYIQRGALVEVLKSGSWETAEVKRVNKLTARVILSEGIETTVPFSDLRERERVKVNSPEDEFEQCIKEINDQPQTGPFTKIIHMESHHDQSPADDSLNHVVLSHEDLKTNEIEPSAVNLVTLLDEPLTPSSKGATTEAKTPTIRRTPSIVPKSNRAQKLREDSIRKKSIICKKVEDKVLQERQQIGFQFLRTQPQNIPDSSIIKSLQEPDLTTADILAVDSEQENNALSMRRLSRRLNIMFGKVLESSEKKTAQKKRANSIVLNPKMGTRKSSITSSVKVARPKSLLSTGSTYKPSSSHKIIPSTNSCNKSSLNQASQRTVAVRTNSAAIVKRVSKLPIRPHKHLPKDQTPGQLSQAGTGVSIEDEISTVKKAIAQETVHTANLTSEKRKREPEPVIATSVSDVPSNPKRSSQKLKYFKKAHEKFFSNQKPLTDFVRRNEQIGVKMTEAMASARQRPYGALEDQTHTALPLSKKSKIPKESIREQGLSKENIKPAQQSLPFKQVESIADKKALSVREGSLHAAKRKERVGSFLGERHLNRQKDIAKGRGRVENMV